MTLEPRLEASDLLVLDGALLGSALWVSPTGRVTPAEDVALSLLHQGEAITSAVVRSGLLECPAAPELPKLVGITLASSSDIGSIQGSARVIRPGASNTPARDRATPARDQTTPACPAPSWSGSTRRRWRRGSPATGDRRAPTIGCWSSQAPPRRARTRCTSSWTTARPGAGCWRCSRARRPRCWQVPWLDAGAEVTGPVVAALEETFRQTWLAAGGEDFPVMQPAGRGPIPLRLVTHESMADTQTLDTYRWMLESAREQVTVVNTFPLQFELQRVLLSLLERGIAVRFLVGNVRPAFNAYTAFPGGQLRELATQVIHGRLDALVEAGAEVYELGLPPAPSWAPELARVLPHVHAKLLSVDGRVFAIGSANLDITASYWESEALLLVEDPAQATALEAQLDALLEHSPREDPDDPAWRARADRRAWLSRHWPSTLS